MCNIRETVIVVRADQLDADWATCCSDEGARIVFVREGSEQLLDSYCALGPGACPIWLALTPAFAVA